MALSLRLSTARGETATEAIARAQAAIQAAVPRAQADPGHPIFHVTAPAQWINDPNGPIFFHGYYHLFYQLHPFSDESGPKYWGHVRSRDLVTWEPLPVALWPSTEAGESEVWSGCCTTNGQGQPMIFYTSIAQGRSPQQHAEQWAATSDDGLLHWQKSPANPVLSEALHGAKKIYDWRDPFVFRDGNRVFLVTGGNLNEAKGGQATVNIYEAENPGLTRWKYRGVLFQDSEAPTAECPNFFQLGKQWVLFLSPYGRVQYFIGDFDAQTCRFHPRTQGVLDYGANFYAPNTMQVPDGRRLVWGWVNGFPSGHGWNGCLSLPRQLSLTRDGQLRQDPAPQLAGLRGSPVHWRKISLNNDSRTFDLPPTNALEIAARIDGMTAKRVELEIKGAGAAPAAISVDFDGSTLQAMGASAPLTLAPAGGELDLRIFIDRSVVEIFANGTACITKTISPLEGRPVAEVRADGGTATVRRLEAWPMKTIW